jgi:hypothetical protein
VPPEPAPSSGDGEVLAGEPSAEDVDGGERPSSASITIAPESPCAPAFSGGTVADGGLPGPPVSCSLVKYLGSNTSASPFIAFAFAFLSTAYLPDVRIDGDARPVPGEDALAVRLDLGLVDHRHARLLKTKIDAAYARK